MEFLVRVQNKMPTDMDEATRSDIVHREREYGGALWKDGRIVRIWRVPGRSAAVSIWSAADASELHAWLAALPIFPWADIEVTALATHPFEDRDGSGGEGGAGVGSERRAV